MSTNARNKLEDVPKKISKNKKKDVHQTKFLEHLTNRLEDEELSQKSEADTKNKFLTDFHHLKPFQQYNRTVVDPDSKSSNIVKPKRSNSLSLNVNSKSEGQKFSDILSTGSFENDNFSFNCGDNMSHASLETPSFAEQRQFSGTKYYEMTYNNETPNFTEKLSQTSQMSESSEADKKLNTFTKKDSQTYVFGMDNFKIYKENNATNKNTNYQSKFSINNLVNYGQYN